MDISLPNTKVMQFLPRPRSRSRSAPSQHHFNLNTVTLENVDSYKYLGVIFKSTGNPAHYMPAARHKITASYHAMRLNYCGLACGTNARLQLSFFAATVTSTTEGAAICTYWRWFRRADGQQGHRLRAGVFGHASTSKRAQELLRFRLGCHTLPSVTGRRAGNPTIRGTMPAMYARCGRRETFGV